MAASLAKLCLAVALAVPRGALVTAASSEPPEGPLPFTPSVGVALYKGCDEKTADIHEEHLIKDMHGKPCQKLDDSRLSDFGVKSCEDTASELTSLVFTFECVVSTMMDEHGQVYPEAADLCFLPKMGTALEGCKEGMDSKIEEFFPVAIEELDSFEAPPEHMLDSFETVLGVFQTCSSTVESYVRGKGVLGPQVKEFCEEGDAESFETMGVPDEDCPMLVSKPLTDLVTTMCSFFVLAQVEDPSTATAGTVNEAVEAFVGHVGGMLEHMEVGGLLAAVPLRALKQQHPLAERLLRLQTVLGGDKHSGKSLFDAFRKPLRKSASWPPASVALAAAAAASALAALGLLAWRRHPAKGQLQEAEQILCAQDTQE